MSNKFYGIGVGPGDPELITLKAVKILKQADVIAVPESLQKESTALAIAKPYLHEDAKVISMVFPMIKDVEKRQEIRKGHAETIKKLMSEGKNVAFLTLGDPMLYSTYSYLLEYLQEKNIEIETVPGIYSFSAISNLLNTPLVLGNERMAVICKFDEDIEHIMENFDTIVFMKISAYREKLLGLLKKNNPFKTVMLVSHMGHSNQAIHQSIECLKKELPYFSTLIMKK